MMTVQVLVNGKAIVSINVLNEGVPVGRMPHRRLATTDDDPDGERVYGFWHPVSGDRHYVKHARRDGAAVLAAKVLANYTRVPG